VTASNDVVFINAFTIAAELNSMLALNVEVEKSREYVISIGINKSTKNFLWKQPPTENASTITLLPTY
jgi:hypothetical protein